MCGSQLDFGSRPLTGDADPLIAHSRCILHVHMKMAESPKTQNKMSKYEKRKDWLVR